MNILFIPKLLKSEDEEKNTDSSLDIRKRIIIYVKQNVHLFIIIFISIILHMYPIFKRTITIGYDEPTWVYDGVAIYVTLRDLILKLTGIENNLLFHLLIYVLITIIIATAFFLYKYTSLKKKNINPLYFFFFSILLAIVLFIYNYNIKFYPVIFREVPIGKTLYFISFSFFGIKEFAPRIVQLLFLIFGVLFLYKTILLFYNKQIATLSGILFIFNPNINYAANYAELGIGVVFFIILVSYCFLKFINLSYNKYLLNTFLIVGIASLYKRELIILAFILFIFILVFRYEYFKMNFKKLLLYLYISLIPIIPFMVFGIFYSTKYGIALYRIFTEWIYYYFIFISEYSSILIFILFITSSIYLLLFKRNELLVYYFMIFFTFYFIYTFYRNPQVEDRFALALVPTIAIFISVFLGSMFGKYKKTLTFISVLLLFYSLSISTLAEYPGMRRKFAVYKNFNIEHHPVDEAMTWIKSKINKEKILGINVRNISFYREKENIPNEYLIDVSADEINIITSDSLTNFIKKENIKYLVYSNWNLPDTAKTNNILILQNSKIFEYANGNKVFIRY